MKKFISLILLIAGITANTAAYAQFSPFNNLNYMKLLQVPPSGSVEDSVLVYDGSDKFVKMIPKSVVVAGKENTLNKTSAIVNYSETLYPNEKAAHDALDLKLNISDLPTNLTLYPTTTASDVSGYVVMVTDIHDARYNTTAVDVSTPTITTTDQLVSERISDAGVLMGQPGVFNVTTFGNIRRLSGTGTSTFYFRVYRRNLAGTETLIGESSNSTIVSSSSYLEFSAAMVWDDGDFEATDRIVIKTYANRIPGNSDPVYQFQFGGMMPVRTLLPVPFSVVDAGYELIANKQNSLSIDGTGTKYPTVDAVNAALPKTYATIVYVNATSPNTATIFDDENPPITNDNALKLNIDNLYIGNDASTWVYNGSTYVTKVVPSTSNFYIEGTLTDAGNSKTANLQRSGGAFFGGALYSTQEIVSKKGASDTVLAGSNFRLFNNAGTAGNIFQLNASNGVDLWNYASGVWNKRFTFSSGGNLTAASFIKLGGTSSQFLKADGSVDTNGYIQNQSTSAQLANIWISGNAMAKGLLVANFGLLNNPIMSVGLDTPVFGDAAVINSWGAASNPGISVGTARSDGIAFRVVTGVSMNGSGLPASIGTTAFQVNGDMAATFASTVTATSFNGSATLTGTPTAPTATAGTNTTQIATTAFVQENARPYKSYTALLFQSGTAVPVDTIIENNTGTTITWARTSIGVYTASFSSSILDSVKTIVFVTSDAFGSANNLISSSRTSSSVVTLRNTVAGSAADISASRVAIEIRVYN